MVSLKDIAQRCGVSTATVSKALNGQPDISEETRKRISDMASELGYLANSAARALKTNKTYNLGVLFVDGGSRGLTHEFFAAVLESFKRTAERNGYDITFISNCTFDSLTMSYLQHCRYRGVDGVFIVCGDFNSPQILELLHSDLPVITLDNISQGKPAVLSDNEEGAASLVRYAYSLGHRRIAFIHGESSVYVTKVRMSGFRRAAGELGLEISEEMILPSRYYQADRCAENIKKLLALEERPTCVLLPDDFSAMGALTAIHEAGLRIPDDLSIMGYDGIVLSEVTDPRITTYRQNSKALGTTAAEMLIGTIEHPDEPVPETVTVSGELVPGGSVARIR